jgi:hypothetical protein
MDVTSVSCREARAYKTAQRLIPILSICTSSQQHFFYLGGTKGSVDRHHNLPELRFSDIPKLDAPVDSGRASALDLDSEGIRILNIGKC